MWRAKKWNGPPRWIGLPKSKTPAPTDPFQLAVRLLARRPYTIAELHVALRKKLGTEKGMREALARLRELGYLDDRKFAEHQASALAQRQLLGSYRIRRELKARLVPEKYVEAAVRQAFTDQDERELLDRVLEKRLRNLRLPLTTRRLHALCQSLLRRGFRSDDIMRAVRARPELKPVAEDAELDGLESSSD